MVGELIRLSFPGPGDSDVKNRNKFDRQRVKIQKYNPTKEALDDAVKEHTSRLNRLNQELEEAREQRDRAEKKAGMLEAENKVFKDALGIADSSSVGGSFGGANASDFIEQKKAKTKQKVAAALREKQVVKARTALLEQNAFSESIGLHSSEFNSSVIAELQPLANKLIDKKQKTKAHIQKLEARGAVIPDDVKASPSD